MKLTKLFPPPPPPPTEKKQIWKYAIKAWELITLKLDFRLKAASVEAKHLTGKLTFLTIDVNHTTGTPDQIEMLINVYDACFRRFKKIMKIVRRIEIPEQREKLQ